ncbi:MAG: hypothetical protein WA014_02560 [Minisyncoccia bacterium]
MKKLLVLLLLALPALGTVMGVSTAMAQAPLAIGGTSTVTLGQSVPIINEQPILPGSVECVGIAPVTYVPSPARVTEIRAWTERALRYDLTAGVLVSPLGVDEAKRLLQYLPNVRFYDRPTYNFSRWPDGTWVWACAQGFSGFDGPKVAADDPARTERLTCFESVNFFVGLIGRTDLFDSPYVQSIENAVGAQVTGGWRVQ